MSASELAAAAQSNRSLVSRGINELFDKGIVFTQENSSKRRYGWKLMLTDKGRQLADLIASIVEDIQKTVNRDISEEDLITFYRTLKILANCFEELSQGNTIQEAIDKCL